MEYKSGKQNIVADNQSRCFVIQDILYHQKSALIQYIKQHQDQTITKESIGQEFPECSVKLTPDETQILINKMKKYT